MKKVLLLAFLVGGLTLSSCSNSHSFTIHSIDFKLDYEGYSVSDGYIELPSSHKGFLSFLSNDAIFGTNEHNETFLFQHIQFNEEFFETNYLFAVTGSNTGMVDRITFNETTANLVFKVYSGITIDLFVLSLYYVQVSRSTEITNFTYSVELYS